MSKPLFLSALAAVTALWGSSSFITNEEYGAMLYENPRGIGCVKCHGPGGNGKTVSGYREGNRTVAIVAPSLRGFTANTLEEGIARHPRYVPLYHLTPGEYHSLSVFLNR